MHHEGGGKTKANLEMLDRFINRAMNHGVPLPLVIPDREDVKKHLEGMGMVEGRDFVRGS